MSSGLRLFVGECTAEQRLHSEYREKIRSYKSDLSILKRVAIIKKHAPALKSRHGFERRILVPPVHKVWNGSRRGLQLRLGIPEPDESFGVIVGQGSKQDPVDHRKDCGVCADA